MRFSGMFCIVLLLFLALNLFVAHVRSDCGLAAVLGRSGCADDIVRVGFPFQFIERGGLIGRDMFDMTAFAADIIVGMVAAVVAGVVTARRMKRSTTQGRMA